MTNMDGSDWQWNTRDQYHMFSHKWNKKDKCHMFSHLLSEESKISQAHRNKIDYHRGGGWRDIKGINEVSVMPCE